jgi:signal peptidase
LENVRIGIYFILATILVVYIIISVFLPEQTVKIFGFKPYVVITESMEPEINVNDLVVVKNPQVDELEVEDIITFYADIDYDGKNEIVTHYIYSIIENDDGELIFRTHRHFENLDDTYADNWIIHEDNVLGTYMFHIPKIGAIIRFVKSPFGIAAMVVNIGVIIGVVYLIKKTDVKPEEKVEENIKE